ncbi:tRNA synthetases class I (M)-domain-containing protein [Suillus subaureus]|uniref:Probable methionine--tRNA ligase, mitochondrial n=1 Tax=Suillus subaureus TaxID=48587 RepID=A0A9P7EDX4_9AGAM|nr:tRNA synthetases class I (M)-domain-containing protein [Suillus subaureus]KAG1818541.1 tRNA synthetases class I (M)-domain-containing protein [Suillus subaureus]
MLFCRKIPTKAPIYILRRLRSPALCQFISTAIDTSISKPFYITTPIFYPNAAPHIGHLYSLVTADIFARFTCISEPDRLVHFLTGTDEHGLKIQKAAKDRGIEPSVLCDALSEQFRRLGTRANISNTVFLRTTEARHREAVEHVWRDLAAQDLIYKGTYSGWYSISDECFYTDSQITHPPSSLTPISIETGSAVEWSSESNYKFRLSSFRDRLLDYYTSNPKSIYPSAHRERLIQTLKDEPLDDLSISRPRERLSWGIPVPGDMSHTMYVWFDALTVYLTGVGFPAERQGSVWPPNIQVIGKDIVRFHALYLPAMLLAMGMPLSHTLLAHAHWTAQQRKMSKSIGNVADPFDAMDTWGVDAVRFYMARVGGRFRDDVDWSPEQLEKHADEIRSLLGNFFLRITSRTIRKRVASAPQFTFVQLLDQSLDGPNGRVEQCMEKFEVGDALDAIILVLREVRSLFISCSTLLTRFKGERCINTHCALVDAKSLLMLREFLRVTGICLQPFIPEAAHNLLDALGVPKAERSMDFTAVGKGNVGEVKGVKLFEGRREIASGSQ